MATVYVTMGLGGAYSAASQMPVYQREARSETITSSGTSAQGSLLARQGEIATIECDSPVWVTVGANPTASMANGRYVGAAQRTDIKCGVNDIVAVLDV